MNIKPIKTNADYEEALRQIENLFDAKPGTIEYDRLDILTTLVEAYEQKHFPVLPPDPIAAILYFMESRGLNRKDLEAYVGSRSRISEVLNHKRDLTLNMIRNLHDGLDIPYELLMQKPKHKKSINKRH